MHKAREDDVLVSWCRLTWAGGREWLILSVCVYRGIYSKCPLERALPLSLSDLFSCSVSVSVSAELERLDRQELCPERAPERGPRPHSTRPCSGEPASWPWGAAGPREKRLSGWESPVLGHRAKPRRVDGSQTPSCLREKAWPGDTG
jgi:hypothetical protein